MEFILSNYQLQKLVELFTKSDKGILLEQTEEIITNKNLLQFYKDVLAKTKNKLIDLKSIEVQINEKGESYFKYKTSKNGTPIRAIHVAMSEESDNGTCPACDRVRELNPKHKIVGVGPNKNYAMGNFGKNRLYQVIVIPGKRKGATTYSNNAVRFIEDDKTEGFRSQVYDDKCPDAEYPSIKNTKKCGGELTIGYGTLVKNYPELKKYKKGTNLHLSQDEAEIYLIKDLNTKVKPKIEDQITVPLTQNQYDAITIFVYNLGSLGPGLENAINSEDEDQIRKWWSKYIYADNVKMRGLVKRRAKELELFFK